MSHPRGHKGDTVENFFSNDRRETPKKEEGRKIDRSGGGSTPKRVRGRKKMGRV